MSSLALKTTPRGDNAAPVIPIFENQLLSYKEAARYLSISEVYLRRLKRLGKIPYVQMGRRGVRFRLSSLSKWVEEREIK